jgi:stringent starvation protein B
MASEQLPQSPYLLRAMHEWMSDNGLTPHIIVDASVEGVEVPEHYVENGKIVLNVSFAATDHLELGNEFVGFSARFSGASHAVFVPVAAVLGIYARETGEGLIFAEHGAPAEEESASGPKPDEAIVRRPDKSELKPGSASQRPHLKIIK